MKIYVWVLAYQGCVFAAAEHVSTARFLILNDKKNDVFEDFLETVKHDEPYEIIEMSQIGFFPT